MATAISLFSGAGGMDLGLRQAGFQIVAAVDFSTDAQATYQQNFPGTPFLQSDISSVSAEVLAGLAGRDAIDLLVGAPPCQGFSNYGKKTIAVDGMIKNFFNIASRIRPKCILIEAVPGVLKRSLAGCENKYLIDQWMEELSDIGYDAMYTIIDAVDYGVPQYRKRLFIVGTNNGIPFKFPAPTHGISAGLLPFETVVKYLGSSATGELHGAVSIRDKDVTFGSGGHVKRNKTNYKVLDFFQPSLTVTAKNFLIHPLYDRTISIREAARLQSFPDSFAFLGKKDTQYSLIGNATPVTVGRIFGEAIQSYLSTSECLSRSSGSDALFFVKSDLSDNVKCLLDRCGDGRLLDGNDKSLKFRNNISICDNYKLINYIEQCHGENFEDRYKVYQDLVCEVGKRIGFSVVFGKYSRGGKNSPSYDGLWLSDILDIVIEAKRSDSQPILMEKYKNYYESCLSNGSIKNGSIFLFVVGEFGDSDIESMIRGTRDSHNFRWVSSSSLVKLLSFVDAGGKIETEILFKFIVKMPYQICLDEIIDLYIDARKN